MRIGFFADQFLPRQDGVVVSMLNVAAGLEARGHEVFFIVPEYPKQQSNNPNIIRIPSVPVPILSDIRLMRPRKKHKEAIKSLRLDVIHSHNQFAAGRLAFEMAKSQNLPHVTTFHTLFPEIIDHYPIFSLASVPAVRAYLRPLLQTSDLSNYELKGVMARTNPLKSRAWRYSGAFCDSTNLVLTPSEHMTKKIRSIGTSTPVETLSNSVQIENFSIKKNYSPHRPLRVVYIGRLSLEKRQAAIIEALRHLPTELIKITFIGGGPESVRYRALVKGYGFSSQVEFKGKVPQSDIHQHLADYDIGILASNGFDTQGLVLLEYMAAGLPIMYCDPNLDDVVAPKSALRVKPDSVHWAKGFKQLVKNPKRLATMAKASSQYRQTFSHLTVAEKLEGFYQQVSSSN